MVGLSQDQRRLCFSLLLRLIGRAEGSACCFLDEEQRRDAASCLLLLPWRRAGGGRLHPKKKHRGENTSAVCVSAQIHTRWSLTWGRFVGGARPSAPPFISSSTPLLAPSDPPRPDSSRQRGRRGGATEDEGDRGTVGGREEEDGRPVGPRRSVSQEDEEWGDTDEGGVEGGDKERERETGEKGDEEHRREERPEEAPGGGSPPYVSPCLGELRKESGSKAGGSAGGGGRGEGDKRGEGGEVAAALGGEEQEEGVRRRLPMTGDGRRVRESVVTPGAGGGAGEEEEGGEEALVLAGPARVGDRRSCPEPVNERLRPGPASSLGPPPPATAEAVAMTMRAFCGSATVARLARLL